GIGGLTMFTASELMGDYDRTIARDCAVTGCDLSQPMNAHINALHDRATNREKLGIGIMSVGAVGAIAGGVLLFMNRGITVYDNSAEARGQTARFDFVPHEDGGVFTYSGGF